MTTLASKGQSLIPILATRKISAVALVFSIVISQASGRSHKQASASPSPSDPGYVFALATANRFLYAWQNGDLANGTVLLSDAIRHSQGPDKLEAFFSGSVDRGFEIHTGHGNRERYSFPVVLISARGTRVVRRASEIVLIAAGKNDWVVDKLP
jgi:hypothetical protein